MHVYLYIYIYTCIYVFTCVYVWDAIATLADGCAQAEHDDARRTNCELPWQ